MKFSYLSNKQWADITRDERFFCAHLYFELKNNSVPFLQLLIEKQIITSNELNPDLWEAGFEVCFYRDYIYELGENNGNKSIKKSKYSQKRTFDLCLFSEHIVIIIEAKSYTGFDSKQLESFKDDKENMKSLLGDQCPAIFTVVLVSTSYNPKPKSLDGFDCKITWEELYDLFKNDVFHRANKSKIEVKDE